MESRNHQYSLASSPWLPSGPVSPKIRSFRIGSVPFQNANARHSRLPVVADAAEAVLAPAVRARPGVVVRERAPRVAVGAVVLPHRPPRPLGEVGPPSQPGQPVRGEPLGLFPCHQHILPCVVMRQDLRTCAGQHAAPAGVAEQADAPGLGPGAERHGGSSPPARTGTSTRESNRQAPRALSASIVHLVANRLLTQVSADTSSKPGERWSSSGPSPIPPLPATIAWSRRVAPPPQGGCNSLRACLRDQVRTGTYVEPVEATLPKKEDAGPEGVHLRADPGGPHRPAASTSLPSARAAWSHWVNQDDIDRGLLTRQCRLSGQLDAARAGLAVAVRLEHHPPHFVAWKPVHAASCGPSVAQLPGHELHRSISLTMSGLGPRRSGSRRS